MLCFTKVFSSKDQSFDEMNPTTVYLKTTLVEDASKICMFDFKSMETSYPLFGHCTKSGYGLLYRKP